MREYDIVIVGASAAGVSAAQAAVDRQAGHTILLVGEEDRLPYKRTTISKSFADGFERDAFALLEPEWYTRNAVDLELGIRVERIERRNHEIQLSNGEVVRYGRLILALGARPRLPRFSEGFRKAVMCATGIREIEQLLAAATRARCVTVVGTGVLGCEVVEQLTRLGLETHFIGRNAHLMDRYLNPQAARYLTELYRSNAVRLHLETATPRVHRREDAFELVLAETGERLRTDLLVYCIGLEPRTELARRAEIAVNRGIRVGADLRTSDNDVFAAGDVAEHPGGLLTHLWRHALEQGAIAGANAAGAEEQYGMVPFRVKCEVFGHYFFSISRPPKHELARYDQREYQNGRYICAYLQRGRVHGVIMRDDKDEQKRYMQAANEHWEIERFEREFELA